MTELGGGNDGEGGFPNESGTGDPRLSLGDVSPRKGGEGKGSLEEGAL